MFKRIKKFMLGKSSLPEGINYHMQDHRGWGNSIHWSEWPRMRVHGHLPRRPVVGDTLTCDFHSGVTHKFQFINVEYCKDPKDMFFANVKHLYEIKK